MRCAFVKARQSHYPVRALCRGPQVSPSGYYGWARRPESGRAQVNRCLLAQIRSIHQEKRKTYGYPRMHHELTARGYACGRHRVARLMRQAGIQAKMVRLWRRSQSGRTFAHIAANTHTRRFAATQPNRRWVADITMIPTAQGWLHLSTVMDLYSRLIVGWAMPHKSDRQLVLDAVTMAIGRRGDLTGALLHSDQGMEYRTAEYHRLLNDHGMAPSMSRKGNCLDNAAMESFFHTLKTEHTHHYRYRTCDEARQSVFEYKEVFYNQQRRHSTLDYMTPVEYERYANPTPNEVSVLSG